MVADLEKQLTAVSKDIKADFEKTTRTWNDKPSFEVQSKELQRIIRTNHKVYFFVSGGTRVRYATMTPDFSPKTRPNYIGSGAGSGGVLFVDKRKPKPGIKARDFDKAIAKKWQPMIGKRINIKVT
ncbi:MAG: hypothetical protein KDD89_00385 [Anaerolineales bacterium]|nr:hypothetical protein [Anaerolineales bacterium]